MPKIKSLVPTKPTVILPREIISEVIPSDCRYIINELLSYKSNFVERKSKDLNNHAYTTALNLRVKHWEIALHYVISKVWDTKHKIPVKKSIRKRYEAKGEVLRAIFLLCERCHSLGQTMTDISIDYPNAANWFGHIFAEFIQHEFATIKDLGSEKNGDKKEQIIAEYREGIRSYGTLDKPKNPLNKDTCMEATYKLFECSCLFAKQSDVFRTDYWKVYIDALKRQLKDFDTPEYNRIFFDDSDRPNKLYMQRPGSGRGKIRIG